MKLSSAKAGEREKGDDDKENVFKSFFPIDFIFSLLFIYIFL